MKRRDLVTVGVVTGGTVALGLSSAEKSFTQNADTPIQSQQPNEKFPAQKSVKKMKQEGKRINPVGLHDPSPYGYAHVTVVPPESTLIYIAGQYGTDENGNLISDDFETQLQQSFANLQTALVASGARWEDVVKITLLSVEHNAQKQLLISAQRNRTWSKHKPASTLIPVPRLALDGMLFEIDAVAIIPANQPSSRTQ